MVSKRKVVLERHGAMLDENIISPSLECLQRANRIRERLVGEFWVLVDLIGIACMEFHICVIPFLAWIGIN